MRWQATPLCNGTAGDPGQIPGAGRGTSNGALMKRTLIMVEPDQPGWLIRIGGIALERNLDKIIAIDRATRLARSRHDSTGHPTGVEVHMLCGETIAIGLHG